jgi:L-ascorbate metabolism protein UlaG (beta-lactamase superfamily)
MIITWQGHSCFKIQDKIGTDGLTVVTDPYDKSTGLKLPNFEADIVTISHDHPDHNYAAGLRGTPFIIRTAGEYDVKDVLIEGIASFHDDKHGQERGGNIIYRIKMDGISIVHLGDLGHKLENSQLERLGGTDILLIPVGGIHTIDAAAAVEVIAQIEPRIVIPMHYEMPDLKIKLDSVDKFIKAIGLEPHREEKLKISKKDLPSENTELVILSL